jgi:hypothetical protein
MPYPLTTSRKLTGKLQFEIAVMLLTKRGVKFSRVRSVIRENLTADPSSVWIEVHYDTADPKPIKLFITATLTEWCSF